MSFLPIVQRELVVAARRRSTFRLRWWTTALAMIVSLIVLLVTGAISVRGGAGASLFGLICWYAAVMSVLSGVFLTADSLSAEKREGTLGLLFLSELKGYDVVLGKFTAQALHAFYCLLALLPAAALSFLLGGITAGQLWRTALALGNILLFSLATGILASAFARDSHRSLGNTLAILLLALGGMPFLAFVGQRLQHSPVWRALASTSPLYPFWHLSDGAYLANPSAFWFALAASGMVAVGFLGIAAWALPGSWLKEPKVCAPARIAAPVRVGSARVMAGRAKTRAERLMRNPVEWLSREQLGTQWLVWLIVIAWGVLVLVALLLGPGVAASPMITAYSVLPFGFLLKLLFAVQATRFFAEGRRSGALAFLLCTPLTSREIVRGHAKALGTEFLWPLVTFLALLFTPASFQVAQGLAAGNLNQSFSAFSGAFLALLFSLRLVMDLFALFWFGTALALTARRPALTPALSVLFVLILPSIFSFCWLDILADIFFISWGVARLQKDLRVLLAQEYQAPQSTFPTRLVAPNAAAPPIIRT